MHRAGRHRCRSQCPRRRVEVAADERDRYVGSGLDRARLRCGGFLHRDRSLRSGGSAAALENREAQGSELRTESFDGPRRETTEG